jgi:hypothetical protein
MRFSPLHAFALLASISQAGDLIDLKVYEKDLMILLTRYVVCNAHSEHSASLYPRTMSNGLFNAAAFDKLFGKATDSGPPKFYKIQNDKITTDTERNLKAVVEAKVRSDSMKSLVSLGDSMRVSKMSDQELDAAVGTAIESPRVSDIKDDYTIYQWDLKLASLDQLVADQRKEAESRSNNASLQEALFELSRETARQRERLAQKHPLAAAQGVQLNRLNAASVKARVKQFHETVLALSKKLEPEVSADFNRKCSKDEFKMLRRTLNQITDGRLAANEMDYVNERLKTFPAIAKPLADLYESLESSKLIDDSSIEAQSH